MIIVSDQETSEPNCSGKEVSRGRIEKSEKTNPNGSRNSVRNMYERPVKIICAEQKNLTTYFTTYSDYHCSRTVYLCTNHLRRQGRTLCEQMVVATKIEGYLRAHVNESRMLCAESATRQAQRFLRPSTQSDIKPRKHDLMIS